MLVKLFSIGNAEDVNTWSNVPFFVAKALENENVKVILVNIEPNKFLSRLYKYSIGSVLNLLFKVLGFRYDFNFFRSSINNFLIGKKIKRNINKIPIVDCNLFLTYSYSSWKYSNTPVIHLCDQLYEEVFLNRNIIPGTLDNKIILREIGILKKAYFVYSTNANTIHLLKWKYGLTNTKELNYRGNLDIEKITIDQRTILELKKSAKIVLFIGKAYFERGVDILLEAFSIFNLKVNQQYELHIIGPVISEITKDNHPKVVLHNYLDKGVENEYNTYIDLLEKSSMFVFPMRFGPLPAAVFEAAFYYTPAIITNIHNIGSDIENYKNGILIEKPDPEKFADAMFELSQNLELWERIAIGSHNHAKKFTLKAMAQTLINQIDAN